jgi:hypothetical protein
MTYSDEDRLGVSATTFLTLCIWLGPDRAVFLVTIAAIGSGWFWLCRKWPILGWATLGFIRGLLGR